MSKERDRKIPIQVYLSENEKYVLDEKIKESKMRNISEYIRHLILLQFTELSGRCSVFERPLSDAKRPLFF